MRLRLPPLIVVLLLGFLMFAVDRLPVGHFDFPHREAASVILASIGALLVGLGVYRFRADDTTMDPFHPEKSSALVTRGIYGLTRNPMYLGFGSVLAGWAIYLGSLPAFLAIPLYVFYMNRFQIVGEEAALEKHFGMAYREYRSKVPRWI